MASGGLRKSLGVLGLVAWGFLPCSCFAAPATLPKALLLQHAALALEVLPARYGAELHAYRDGGTFHAWQRFVTVSGLAGYEAESGDRRFHVLARDLLADRRGLDGNDDDLWVAEAALDWAERETDTTRRRESADDAARIFARIAAHDWDGVCGGGVWWDHAHTYKNAITNELFMDVAARLYGVTGATPYRDWAEQSWRWFDGSGMIAESQAVNDGLDACCRNNDGAPYSYNQGVILDALRHMSHLTGDARLLDRAARIARQAIAAGATPDGGFAEAREPMSVDSRIFRGIFVRALGRLVPVLPVGEPRHALGAWLTDESTRVWASRSRDMRFDGDWKAAPFEPSAQAQLTAADLFVAAAHVSGDVVQ